MLSQIIHNIISSFGKTKVLIHKESDTDIQIDLDTDLKALWKTNF